MKRTGRALRASTPLGAGLTQYWSALDVFVAPPRLTALGSAPAIAPPMSVRQDRPRRVPARYSGKAGDKTDQDLQAHQIDAGASRSCGALGVATFLEVARRGGERIAVRAGWGGRRRRRSARLMLPAARHRTASLYISGKSGGGSVARPRVSWQFVCLFY